MHKKAKEPLNLIIKYKHHASQARSLLKGSRKLWNHVGNAVLPFAVLALLIIVIGCGVWFWSAVAKDQISPLVFEVPFIKVPFLGTPSDQPAAANPHAYGFSAGELVDLNQSQLNARLDDFKKMGMTWVRMDMPWSVVQADGQSAYNWTTYDRVVDGLQQRGLSTLIVLDYTPTWARQSHCKHTERCPPADHRQFAAYAATAVNHFKSRVKHWEIWNEPNHASFWGGAADATAYTRLLIATHDAIKKQDPSAVVVTGGLAPAFTESGSIAPTDFLTAMYKNGAKNYFDAVGDHAYSYPATPKHELAWSGWTQMRNLRPIMVDNGDFAKAIWITEYGAPTNGPGPVATASNYNFDATPDHVDEPLQAEIARQAIELHKSYAWVGPMFWYQYKDKGTDTGSNEYFFGLLRADGSKKPAYNVLQQAIKQ